MPSTYTTNNRLEMQNPGENLNTWGAKLNNDTTALIDFSLSGVVALAPSGPVTLSTANGTPDQARAAILNCTGGSGGTLTIPAVSHVYQVRNNCTGGVIFTTGSGVTATVEAGSSATVICDGANCYRFADAADIAAAQAAAEAYALSLSFAASGGQLPGQAGNAGNVLSTNGSTALWTSVAPQANILSTSQNFSLTGTVTASPVAFNGSTGVVLTTTIPAGAITSGMLATGVAIANLGFTPVNLAGGNTIAGPNTLQGVTTHTGAVQTTPVGVTFSATAMTLNAARSNVFTTTFKAKVTVAPKLSNQND